jgi:hypothetical protein
MDAVNRLSTKGPGMDTCAKSKQDADDKRYKQAKKRYEDTLNDCMNCVDMLRKKIGEAEKEFTRTDIFKKMEDDHGQRRKKWKEDNNRQDDKT